MANLCEVTEKYRVNTEDGVAKLIEEAKSSGFYTLTKYSSMKKDVKVKGEITESYYLVTLVKSVDDPKDPVSDVNITYKRGAF